MPVTSREPHSGPSRGIRAGSPSRPTFSGEEALAEVALADGRWSWAIVGTDPVECPLFGGGDGGVEEMRDYIEEGTACFGLLRLDFGRGAKALQRVVFVYCSETITGRNFDEVAGVKASCFEVAKRFANPALVLHLEGNQACTPEGLILELRQAAASEPAEVELLTLEAYQQGLRQQKRRVSFAAPKAAVAEIELEMDELDSEAMAERQKRKFRKYHKGDLVELLSRSEDGWSDQWVDGEVVEVLLEGIATKLGQVRVGSVQVLYDRGARSRWVAPNQVEKMIRPSARPRAPAMRTGLGAKEMVGWFLSSWSDAYLELNEGFLQWWSSLEEAKSNAAPLMKPMDLTGLRMEKGAEEAVLRLQAEASHEKMISLRFHDASEAGEWSKALFEHSKFIEDMAQHRRAKETGLHLRRQTLGHRRATLQSLRGGLASSLPLSFSTCP